MIVCPVCENQQAQGIECDVCGIPFEKGLVAEQGHRDAPVAMMEGLETTAVDEPVDTASLQPLAEDAPCVWCKHVQPSGLICDRCGMQRHRGAIPREDEEEEVIDEEAAPVICPDCGLPNPFGKARCRGCGSKIPSPED